LEYVLVRWPNDETGGYFKLPGLLIGPETALTISDCHIEVHLVTASSTPHEYNLHHASHPLFYVGNDHATIFHDLRTLPIAEFASKYVQSEFHNEKLV